MNVLAVKVEVLKLNNSVASEFTLSGNKGVYRIAVYISATRWAEDEQDSTALLSLQSEQCRKYLKEHPEFKKVGTYTDRNASRDTNREWHHLLDDAECRKMDAVLVWSIKQIEQGFGLADFYVGKFLYPAGIRFIAIEDGFDSLYDNMEEYLRHYANLFNSYTGSRRHTNGFKKNKIRSVSVPYGYIYDPESNPQIIVDEETAPNVKKLFELAVAGTRVVDMVRYMNERHIATPKQRRGQLYGAVVTGSPYWKNTVVKSILQNPCYTGDYVTGRTREQCIDGVNHYEKVPQDEWLIIPDHHEPIISREMYQRSLEVTDSRRFQNAREKGSGNNAFRNIFWCGHCGTGMTCSRAGVRNGKPYARIYCASGKYQKDGGCETYDVPFEDTINQLRNHLSKEIQNAKKFISNADNLWSNAWVQKGFETAQSETKKKQDELLEHSEQGVLGDDSYHVVASSLQEQQNYEKAFSTENPWAVRFAAMDENDLPDFSREAVKQIYKRVYVYSDGRLEIQYVDDEWKRFVTETYQKYHGEGDVFLWEEEIEL